MHIQELSWEIQSSYKINVRYSWKAEEAEGVKQPILQRICGVIKKTKAQFTKYKENDYYY